ncbi:hypothetical protein LJR225_001526 [Phenylobacterium sp. LjRoot225]|uniref:hypothetical protein n=1 Tax=Phenylobacterium sp. LjRoot225 TaxID=3342285 RepID=UPI003ED05689
MSENRAGGSIQPRCKAQNRTPAGARKRNHASSSDVARRLTTGAWIVAVAFVGLVAAREANAEFIVNRIQRQLETGGPAAPHPAPCLSPCPARASEAIAAAEVRAFRESEAQSASDPTLSRAEAQVRQSLARNPLLAANWSRLAQIEAYASPNDSRQALATLAISYQAAPYDPTGAGFRIDYVLNHWSAAPRSLRRRALDEIIWLSSVKPDLLDQLRARPRDPAAQYALELAIIQAEEAM